MKSSYRLMLGQGSLYAQECFAGNFIGADFRIEHQRFPSGGPTPRFALEVPAFQTPVAARMGS